MRSREAARVREGERRVGLLEGQGLRRASSAPKIEVSGQQREQVGRRTPPTIACAASRPSDSPASSDSARPSSRSRRRSSVVTPARAVARRQPGRRVGIRLAARVSSGSADDWRGNERRPPAPASASGHVGLRLGSERTYRADRARGSPARSIGDQAGCGCGGGSARGGGGGAPAPAARCAAASTGSRAARARLARGRRRGAAGRGRARRRAAARASSQRDRSAVARARTSSAPARPRSDSIAAFRLAHAPRGLVRARRRWTSRNGPGCRIWALSAVGDADLREQTRPAERQ